MSVAVANCCPPGPNGQTYGYVNSLGNFYNVFTGTYMQMLTWTGGPVSAVYGKCVLHQASPAGYGEPANPIDCPCCPDPYVYVNGFGCTDLPNLKTRVDSIPCISCICPDPDPPLPPAPCVGCESNAIHTSFVFDPTIKNCIDCNKQGEPRLTNDPKLNAFMPDFMIDPVINFRLDL